MRPAGSHHDDILSEYSFVHSQVKTPNSGYGQNMRGAESVSFAQSGLLPGQIHSLKELFLSLPIFYVVQNVLLCLLDHLSCIMIN